MPVELPDSQQREAILKVHAKDVKWLMILIVALARATAGAVIAELLILSTKGALRASKNATYYCRIAIWKNLSKQLLPGYQRKGSYFSC